MQHARSASNRPKDADKDISDGMSSFLRRKPSLPMLMEHRAGSRFATGSMSTNTTGTTLIIGKTGVSSTVGNTGTRKFPPQLGKPKSTNAKPSLELPNKASDDANLISPDAGKANCPIQMPLWFHEPRSYAEEIIIDSGAIPRLKAGNIYELEPLEKENKKLTNKFVFIVQKNNIVGTDASMSPATMNAPNAKAKANFQISLLSTFQKLLDIPPRATIQLRQISNIEEVMLDAVEVYLKDVNFSRDSQWSFSSSMVGSCCYVNQRVSFSGNRIGQIKTLYREGRPVFSGYVGMSTNIIFRSESAKLVFLVQLSREMWHFEENGEIMFHKLVNALFPKIFKKWRSSNAHHSITIVLFTSVDLTYTPWVSLGGGERPSNCQDYYRVVVDQVSVFRWDKIMAALRLEFANFKRDILLHLEKDVFKIRGEPCPAVKSNLLEAINLSLSLVSDRFRNTDLRHSVNHLIVITPGTGLFDVDLDQLTEISKKMSSLDLALDVVSLSQVPLHTVPLFRYRDAEGKVCHCVPNWCDISYYAESVGKASSWKPRCKIYELQMMGVMEDEVNEIQIERLNFKDNAKTIEAMDKYDDNLFKPIKKQVLHTMNKKLPTKNARNLVIGPKTSSSLLLMRNAKPSSNLSPVLPQINTSATNHSVLGTVANAPTESSALSTLYTLNKFADDNKSPLLARNGPLKTSSTSTFDSQRVLKPAPSEPKLQTKRPVNKTNSSLRRNTTTSRENMRLNKWSARKEVKAQEKKLAAVELLESDELNSQYWMNIENPCQQSTVNKNVLSGRWAHVFPPKIRRKMFKWRSLKSPADLPISTSLFPTSVQLQTDYTFQNYVITLNYENSLELLTTRELMREMIGLRLAMGFQICHGEKVNKFELERKPVGSPESIIKYLLPGDCTGMRVYLSINDEIHSIFCDYDGTLNVQMYRKTQKPNTMKISLGSRKPNANDVPLIRTRYADEYTPSKIDLKSIKPSVFNWNQFDQLLAGYDDAVVGDKAYHKMKFVVMPAEIPSNLHLANNESLSDEEIRVEGLRKLIALIERGKYVRQDDAKRRSKKEEILPEISFYTGNLYDFLSEQAEHFNSRGTKPDNSLMIDGLRFNTNIRLHSLAQELQAEGGVNLVDRAWHFKLHLHCFLGSELVSWLIEAFDDIDNREEATEYGQELMRKGLFKHVENRHGFLDGHYFYEFNEEYADNSYKASNSTSWFRKKNQDGHDSQTTTLNNSTPVVTNQSDNESSFSAGDSTTELRKVISQNWINESDVSSFTDSQKVKKTKKFMISKNVKYNCDPLGKSFRPELLNVHYDSVHNPEHCYHIRLQWLNTSAKFIDEAIIGWARLCERYGLKLVETPWRELCIIPNINPFHSFVSLKLALNPLTDPEFMDTDVVKTNKFYYHLHLLKKADFLLDNRGTKFFKKDNIEICYSWGMPIFKYAQFIHKTGSYIVELRDNGDFFMAPNNTHILRVNTLASSMPELSVKYNTFDSQKVMLDFRESCKNEKLLREVFREAAKDLNREYNEDFLLYT